MAAGRGGARSILVVDDEPDICEAIQSLLETFVDKAHVYSAASGPQGLKVLQNQAIDLILTDYRMPGMNGVEFLQRVSQQNPGIPHIIVTAFDRELVRELGASASHERIVQKPFEPEALIGLVQTALAG